MKTQLDAADPRTAWRVKHATRVLFIAGGLGAGLVAAVVPTRASTRMPWWLFAAGTPLGAALGVLFRRDRCSVCKATLPVRVFDDACPACGSSIVAIVDGDRRLELPVRAPRQPDAERPERRVPYRAGSTAARDAAEDALDDTRTDVDARLARLRAEPAIARAITEKDEHALYTLVRARRKTASSLAEEAALDALLADPRRRLDARRRPWLFARLGSGLVLASPRDQDRRDKSFIADQILVLATYMVMPIGTYLVRRPASGGLEILGGLPLPGWLRMWRALVVGAVACVLAFTGHGVWSRRTSVVHLLNGLDVPVTTRTPNGASVTLAPGAHDAIELRRGPQVLVTYDAKGRWIEEVDVDVPGDDALVVYDVAGAMAVRREELFYTVSSPVPGDLAHEVIVGQRVIVRDPATYAFTDPPRATNSFDGSDRDHRVWHAAGISGGWRAARGATDSELVTIDLLQSVALAEPEDDEAVNAAVEATSARKRPSDTGAFLERLVTQAPSSLAVRARVAHFHATQARP